MRISLSRISKMETNQSLQRYHFKSNSEICFKQVTSVQCMPSSNWILKISNNFILKWKSPWEFIFSGPVYTSVLSLVLVHVRKHAWQGPGPAWCPRRFWSEGNRQKLEVPEVRGELGGRQTLKKLKGPLGPFLESQNISLVVHQRQMGRQWVADPLVTAGVKRVKITSRPLCVI